MGIVVRPRPWLNKPPVGTQINWGHPLSRGIVGCWLFNEGSGETAHDIAAARNHGILTNTVQSVWTRREQRGSVIDFDGTDDRVEIAEDAALKPAKISVAMWFKPDTTTRFNSALMKTTVSSWSDGYGIAFDPAGTLIFFINSYNTNFVSVALTASVWYFMVGTYDLSNIRIYINGIEVASTAFTTAINHSTTPLQIAKGRHTDDTRYRWDGPIENTIMYDRALSPEEVLWLFRAPYSFLIPQSPRINKFGEAAAAAAFPVVQRHLGRVDPYGILVR